MVKQIQSSLSQNNYIKQKLIEAKRKVNLVTIYEHKNETAEKYPSIFVFARL